MDYNSDSYWVPMLRRLVLGVGRGKVENLIVPYLSFIHIDIHLSLTNIYSLGVDAKGKIHSLRWGKIPSWEE
jgi:hypothetical protein